MRAVARGAPGLEDELRAGGPSLAAAPRARATSAANVLALLDGSAIIESHRWCDKVQDAYALRCAPQVHGACRDLLDYVEATVAVELNAATDNPLVLLDEGEIVSAGNFHGQPLAFALDALAIAVAELASISERRIERLVNPSLSDGLPPFLVEEGGLNSGFMIPQYVAAALVSENKVLAHPASVDSIPTSAGQEDHVSMGNAAGLKALQVLDNVERTLAIELLAGAQAVEFLAPLRPGRGAAAAHDFVRTLSERLVEDRSLSADIERVADAIRSGAVVSEVERDGGGARMTGMATDAETVEALCGDLSCDPRAARHDAERPLVADGGAAADAPQQPRSRRSRSIPSGSSCTAAPGRRRATTTRSRRSSASLLRLGDDETLLVQSGKPVGVFRTHEWAPRVLIANSLLVPRWATWDEFRRLEAEGLTMFGQMTAGKLDLHRDAGDPAGDVPDVRGGGRAHFGSPDLTGRTILTAGLGGMGGAQPLAATMAGAAILCVEVDPSRIERRLETRYLDEATESLDDAVAPRAGRGGGGAGALRRAARERGGRRARSSRGAASASISSPTRPRRTTR